MDLLKASVNVKKLGRDGKTRSTRLTLSADEKSISWNGRRLSLSSKPESERVLPVKDIVELDTSAGPGSITMVMGSITSPRVSKGPSENSRNSFTAGADGRGTLVLSFDVSTAEATADFAKILAALQEMVATYTSARVDAEAEPAAEVAAEVPKETPTEAPTSGDSQVTLMVNGLNCGGCKAALTDGLKDFTVVEIQTKSETGAHPNKVVVEGDEGAIKEAIAKVDNGRGKFTIVDPASAEATEIVKRVVDATVGAASSEAQALALAADNFFFGCVTPDPDTTGGAAPDMETALDILQLPGDLTTATVEKILQACKAKAAAINCPMNIAVCDAHLETKGFLRMDGAWIGSIDIAFKKARTARDFNMDTRDIGPLCQPGMPLYGIEHSNQGLITFGGGVLLKNAAGTVIGAIGVSGGSVEADHDVAAAGIPCALGLAGAEAHAIDAHDAAILREKPPATPATAEAAAAETVSAALEDAIVAAGGEAPYAAAVAEGIPGANKKAEYETVEEEKNIFQAIGGWFKSVFGGGK